MPWGLVTEFQFTRKKYSTDLKFRDAALARAASVFLRLQFCEILIGLLRKSLFRRFSQSKPCGRSFRSEIFDLIVLYCWNVYFEL